MTFKNLMKGIRSRKFQKHAKSRINLLLDRPKTTGNGSGFTISRTIIHPDHSIIRRSAAPPVGTYNVNSLISYCL